MKNLFIQKAFLLETAKRKPSSVTALFSLDRWFREKLAQLNVAFFDACCPEASTGFPTRLKADKSGMEYLDTDGTWKDVTP